MSHHRPHPHRPSADMSRFYVITPISNAVMYKRRYELYWWFKDMCADAGVTLITVEQAFGDRPHMVTVPHDETNVQVRTVEELWHKENMINLGIRQAMEISGGSAREIAWVDADCFPMCRARDWFENTWHQLQHHEFVQMWEHLINFGPDFEPIGTPQLSFMATYAHAGHTVPLSRNVKHTLSGNSGGTISLGRPGLAWAANVSALNKVGLLIDFCILGSGDWHMAHGLVGAMMQGSSEHKYLSKYSHKLFEWQELCERHIKRDVGFVKTTVGHWWHGAKEGREYGSRGSILIDNAYDPDKDIKYDTQGLIQLETWTPRQIKLRDQIRSYFRRRNEDSIQVN